MIKSQRIPPPFCTGFHIATRQRRKRDEDILQIYPEHYSLMMSSLVCKYKMLVQSFFKFDVLKSVYLKKKEIIGFDVEEQKNITKQHINAEINTFSAVLRSVDHWAAASICYKDVVHSNYCVSEFSTKVSFQNKL